MRSSNTRAFDAEAFLESAGIAKRFVTFRRAEPIFSQGDVCDSVMYIRKGGVKLSVRSRAGREAVVAVLGPGDFFGEGALAGQPLRMGDATALTISTVLVLKKEKMLRLLHKKRELADRFIAHMLGTNIRIEEDLLGQLFTHDEKRTGLPTPNARRRWSIQVHLRTQPPAHAVCVDESVRCGLCGICTCACARWESGRIRLL